MFNSGGRRTLRRNKATRRPETRNQQERHIQLLLICFLIAGDNLVNFIK